VHPFTRIGSDNDIHTARVGLNYSFSRDSEPLK
jgi:hypothetical protein